VFPASLLLLLVPAAALATDLSGLQVSTLKGATVRYEDVKGDKATVIAFMGIKCPVSQSYQSRMNRLYSAYSAKGVSFLFVDANANEPAAEIELYAKQARLAFPVHKDYNNRAADLLGAQTTPEMFVIDAAGTVRYHGAIDDATNEARVKTHGLRDALDAVLAGKDPQVKELKAFGCVLHRAKKES
jgi:thiol-disulfide isomerase/thioredoxin